MRSLRSRLIVGVSIVALVPLALSIYLLSRRIEATVREQAAGRLEAAIERLEAGLAADGERIARQLEILAKDPALKRLYLLRTAGVRDLTERLAEDRFLLGLDFLHVTDTGGAVIADAAAATSSLSRPDRDAPEARAFPGLGAHRAAIVRLAEGAGLALAAGVSIQYEGKPAGILRGGLVLDASFLARLQSASEVELVLSDADGRVLASTLAAATGPGEMPAQAPPRAAGTRRVRVGGESYWSRSFTLAGDPQPDRDATTGSRPGADTALARGTARPAIAGLVPTAAADRTIAAFQLASVALGLLGLGVAIGLGVLWSSQVARPVERLAAISQRIARGEWDDPIRLRSVRELQTLVAAFESMRRDLVAYRERLVTSERQAAWGQMARKVAHEIKNPLTPIAVSVADLKRSFERNRDDFPAILDQAVKTIAAEVDALKRILQEFSDFARLPAPSPAPCRVSELMADLAALYAGEVAANRLELRAPGGDVTITVDRGQIRQALVNLIQNGLEAIAPGGRVVVTAAAHDAAESDAAGRATPRAGAPAGAGGAAGGREALEFAVADDGPGLSPERRAELFVPGFTTKAGGSGLGLTIVQRIVNDHGGSIAVESEPGRGTTVRLRLPLEPVPA